MASLEAAYLEETFSATDFAAVDSICVPPNHNQKLDFGLQTFEFPGTSESRNFTWGTSIWNFHQAVDGRNDSHIFKS